MKGASLGLLLLVLGADMLASPPLKDSSRPAGPEVSRSWSAPQSISQASQMYLESVQPADWEKRRTAAAYLLEHLNPPHLHRTEWEELAGRLRQAGPPATAWDCVARLNQAQPRAGGLLGGYENRLNGLRRQQLSEVAETLKPVLQADDYRGFLQRLPARGESSGALGLILDLRPMAQIGREDLLPYPVWWGILANHSNAQALQAGLRLSQGKAPQLPYRQEGPDCVCWSAGPDDRDEGGLVEASLTTPPDSDPGGDWIYRFRW